MIISCPNCGARFRLAAALAQPARMRCAACDHRWIADPEDEIDAPPASPPLAAPPPEPEATLAQAALPGTESESEPEPERPRSTVLRTVAALILGGALAVAAGGLWVARIDPASLPVVGDRIAALAPKPLPLDIRFTARTTDLAAGDKLLEISGTIRNGGTAAVTLPDFEARLATPAATVRRWRIAAPVVSLDPGRSVAFSSTASGFPAEATLVTVRAAR